MSQAEIDETIEILAKKYEFIFPYLDERSRRIWAAVEADAIGWGGVSRVAVATGMSRDTIRNGLKELAQWQEKGEAVLALDQVRRSGGGRKRVEQKHEGIEAALESLIEPGSRGDPQSPLRWTTKSSENLAKELQQQGYPLSSRTIQTLLKAMGYSLQSNRKTLEGSEQPDRDAQFKHIAQRAKAQQQAGQPVISVDAKKRELIGEFYQNSSEWRPQGQPRAVNTYDFVNPKLGKVIPYGVYDLCFNQGWVSVGISRNTAEFAVETIRRWWDEMGQPLYPQATDVLITADCGGSNDYRSRLWKAELQLLADELGLTFEICHFPPGTSKWNKIEHRLFSQISQSWRGQPLTTRQMVVNLISQTTTQTGLKVHAQLDEQSYETGIEILEDEFAAIAIERDEFYGEWNYRIKPRTPNSSID
ncbi:MAG TPA: ISAzo13 family transposase [Coleofasciculaceae cyanobacterium]|jgi:transposase